MRELRTCAWVAVVVAASSVTASAQQGTIASTGSGFTTGSLTGTGGLIGSSSSGGTGQSGGSSLSSGGTSSSGIDSNPVNGGIQLQQLQTMTAPTAPTGTYSSSSNKSNFLSGYFANPYYQGANLTGGNRTTSTPGGFGQPLYNTTGGTGAVTNRGTGGLGAGRTGLNSQNASNQSGILIPIPTQIAYTATMQFPTPPVASGKIVSEVRSVIDATPMIANSKAIQIITDANNNVTIRGTVKDADEARLVEGLVRVTPGVGSIRNELSAPVAVSINR